ncbi:phage terminase large subunit [Staphylococcus sp. LKG3-3]|uniref:phage terminase large subunit n=1 Tax=Staphylococcus sp. LKG3-3 TaxID=3399685 RepID=UPI003D3EC8B1
MKKLSKEQINIIREHAIKERARRKYEHYLELVHHGHYEHFAHTRLICKYLQRIADGEQLHLMVELPPRHGKSMTVTETFPSYFLGRNPDKRVITSAYNDDLARKFGRLNRNKFAEFARDIFDEYISGDNSSTSDWGVEDKRGGMISTGIGGSITGQGADCLIIDDPIKNAKEALSKTIRENIWNEWESTLSTRLHDGASVIVIMTRWHEDDLIGRLLESSPYDWERIRLPAIAEDDDDKLGRDIGDPLCPELGYGIEWANLKKQEVGSRTWSSLYQQRPAPAEGAIFQRKWFKYIDTAPARYDDLIISWDFAFKSSDTSDYVAGQVWQKTGGEFYCIDQIHAQMDFTQSVQAVVNLKNKYPRCRTILIEDKANGPAIINTLKKKVSGIIPITPKESKVARAFAITPYFEAGNVYFKKSLPHLNDMVEEIAAFDSALHDDNVDAMTQALNYFAERPAARVIGANAW